MKRRPLCLVPFFAASGSVEIEAATTLVAVVETADQQTHVALLQGQDGAQSVPKCSLSKYGFSGSGVRTRPSAERAEAGL
ncbi:hypothetical protein [Roseomonas rosulenta]|uniref:hypothetical protein n=1 Tax=Roseomonas rosulenta TaxID=2748667 RepID=UPI0018DF2CC6|nr:hypothetical protein [Roseomonas rosulenta]